MQYSPYTSSEPKQKEVTIKLYLPDHQHDLDLYMKGAKVYAALFEIDQMCRTQLKHGDGDEKLDDFAQKIRDEINQVHFTDWYE